MDFLELAKKRYSCRKFASTKVEDEKINKIIEAGILAPTAVNFQPFKIWVIKSPESVSKLLEVTRFTFGAPVVLAVGGREPSAWVRESDQKSFVDIDASIVATHMMLETQDLGLGTTWVGYFDEDRLKELFPQMREYNIVALFPLGYPADDAEPSVRHFQRKTADEIVSVI